jgi:hypothetical protein
MSTDPNTLMQALRARLGQSPTSTTSTMFLSKEQIAWIVATIDAQDAQIAALRDLQAKTFVPPAPPESVCEEANRTSGTRQSSYGHPVYDFTRTARIWEVILERGAGEISPEQVGLCMIGVKISRQCHKPKRDNLVDIAGYAQAVQLIQEFDPADQ